MRLEPLSLSDAKGSADLDFISLVVSAVSLQPLYSDLDGSMGIQRQIFRVRFRRDAI